jgi:cyclopropane-fatty-acyl-phospholipid synthase
MSREKATAEEILGKAGVLISGSRPWDIQIHNHALYERVMSQGVLGLGEAYMEKWWDCDRIDLFVERILRSGYATSLTLPAILLSLRARFFNLQSKFGAKKVAEEHYDLSNKLYFSFLDPYNQYSCGYFKNTDDLNTAQEQKLDLICRKLQLQKDDRVLDIGCGWGGFAKYAAGKYGCSVVGITISKEQAAYAKEFTARVPIEIRIQDYRDLQDEKFDKIVSVGMLEHVGYKNYRTLLRTAYDSLKEDGLFLLHTIGQNASSASGNPWIHKYIFPNGMLPSLTQISRASEKLFIIEDLHNFGPYYSKTLRAWDANFQKNWTCLANEHSETFYRMFRFYFNSCAGAFRARRTQLWQIVLSKGASDAVYTSAR